MQNFGIFEVDCRQRSETETGLSYVSRALPFREQIERIHAEAEAGDIPVIFTTCCSNRLLSKDDPRGTLVVPMDEQDTDWLDDVASHRVVYIEKRNWGNPIKNTHHCAWDMFRHNENAKKLLAKLGISHWIVYGVGIDLCIPSAVRGLLDAGCTVTILDDILVNNVNGTPETTRKMLETLGESGVKTMPSDEFLKILQRAVA